MVVQCRKFSWDAVRDNPLVAKPFFLQGLDHLYRAILDCSLDTPCPLYSDPVSSTAAKWAEYIRFPVACSATCTFVVWNTILFPYVYFVGLKNDERQKQFYEFASSYGVMQRHVFNILYAVLNILWASPPRPVEWIWH